MKILCVSLILLFTALLGAERVYYSDGRSVELTPADGITAAVAAAPAPGPFIQRWNAGGTHYLIRQQAGGLPVYRHGAGYLVARPELFWRGTGDVAILAARYGLTLTEILPGYGLYKFTVAGDAVAVAQRITEAGHGWAFPNLVREVRPRVAIPQDPFYAEYQWFLNNDGGYRDVYGNPVETLKRADIRFEDALRFLMKIRFEPGKYTTKIAIMDSGVVTTHPDLIGDGGKMDPGYDAIRDEPGGDPHVAESHGTNCAGITAAESNDIGVSGVCPWCGLYPILVLEGAEGSAISDEMYLKTYERLVADPAIVAVNCSFGVTSEYGDIPMMPGAEESHTNFMKNGRGGKGGIIVYASGNDGVDASYDGLFRNEFEFERAGKTVAHRVVVVGATSAWDTHIDYANWGMYLGITAPSLSSSPVIGIATTTIPGSGDIGGDYLSYFSGTSAAAPVVTGAMGFIFSLNPALTLEEAEEILYTSADKINPETGMWDAEGFSPKFGYGRLNLHKAARLALGYPMCDPLTVRAEVLNALDDDCDGWVDEEVVIPSKVGEPCVEDADCLSSGYLPEQMLCLDSFMGYNARGGYCVLKPSGTPCPDGTVMERIDNIRVCLRECGYERSCGREDYYCNGEILGYCLPRCMAKDDCPEGHSCTAEGTCDIDASPVGGPCVSEADCLYNGSYCDTSKPGGYCYLTCDQLKDSMCPENSKCIFSTRSGTYLCAGTCTSDEDCRPEADYYKCHLNWTDKSGVCFRPCRNNADCGDAECQEGGRCVPYGWEAPDDETADGDLTDALLIPDADEVIVLPEPKEDDSACALVII
ncbi:MAG TPA: S8 family serine peptidase [bacterium]|nr:S8 family serine peptidase [bacterium]